MKIKAIVFFTFIILAVASLKLSVFADENNLHKSPDVKEMVLVEKPEKFFNAQYSFKTNSLNDHVLVLKMKDSQSLSGVCNYFAQKTEFDQKNASLVFVATKDFCPNDRFGKSEGEVYWTVPKSLMQQKAKLCLVINNQKIGLIDLAVNKNNIDVTKSCQ